MCIIMRTTTGKMFAGKIARVARLPRLAAVGAVFFTIPDEESLPESDASTLLVFTKR